jgi:hypothetical protein
LADNLKSLLDKVNTVLKDGQLFYFANDPERELGLERVLENFHLLHIDASQYLEHFKRLRIKYFCLEESLSRYNSVFRSSVKLLENEQTAAYLVQNKTGKQYAQTFKISPAFRIKAQNMGFEVLNPQPALNRIFENKLSQLNQIAGLPIQRPKAQIIKLADAVYETLATSYGNKFVLQFDRGHTGSGTFFIEDEMMLNEHKLQYPERRVRISEFIEGPTYTLNACATAKGTFLGGLSYQITGIEGLTTDKGATVGNDFAMRDGFADGTLEKIKEDVELLGRYMFSKGFKGMFGVDLIISNGQHKLIEINARQPASIPFYTKIQLLRAEVPLSLIHLAEFLKVDYDLDPAAYNQSSLGPLEYAQIFARADSDSIINTQAQMGIYRLQSDNSAINFADNSIKPNTIFLDEDKDKPLIFQKAAYSVDELVTQPGMLLLAPIKGRNIKHGQEVGRLQLNQTAISGGKLTPWIREALMAIKQYTL